MKLINKVTVSKFRSFGKNVNIECLDLNIFSGSNDSGKSNVIKALNLFFNERTDNSQIYNPYEDFNKWFRDNNERGERNIEITIHFNKGSYKDPSGINNGFIAKKTFGIDGSRSTAYFLPNEAKINSDSVSFKRADAVVRNIITYIYIPAIRDKQFQKELLGRLYMITTSNRKLLSTFDALTHELNGTFNDFGASVLKDEELSIIPEVHFATLLESMSFSTDVNISITKRGRGNVKDNPTVPMMNRGDGIQMQFLSFLLSFISKNDTKHRYIWGFEEPEIAYEFKKQFKMAETFAKMFAKDSQIFVTTHSPAFIFNEYPNTKQYRVYKGADKVKKRIISKIDDLNTYTTSLFNDTEPSEQLKNDLWGASFQKITNIIGSSILRESGDYKALEQKIRELDDNIQLEKREKEILDKKVQEITSELSKVYPSRIFICEDKKGVKIWEYLFSLYQLNDIKILPSKGCKNDGIEQALIYKINNENQSYNPKIYRELDRDGYMQDQVDFLEEKMSSKFKQLQNYRVKFLPVNEIENFAVLLDDHFTKDFVKRDEDKWDGIRDALLKTAKENTLACSKIYDKDKAIFQNKEYEMRDSAKSDILSLFPGKDIGKLKHNFNAERIITSKTIEYLPNSLITFLDDIKHFYES